MQFHSVLHVSVLIFKSVAVQIFHCLLLKCYDSVTRSKCCFSGAAGTAEGRSRKGTSGEEATEGRGCVLGR